MKHVPFPPLQEVSLGLVTILWGGTYFIIQYALETSGPLFFIGARFLIAACVVMFFMRSRVLKGIPYSELWRGGLGGIILAVGCISQTVGLQTITSSRSAFLTALYVPLVPLLQWIILRKAPHKTGIIGIILSFVGLILLADPWNAGLVISKGDAFTLLATGAFALEIVCIGLFALNVDSQRMTVVQLIVGAFLSFLAMPFCGEHVPSFHWEWVMCVVGMGMVSAATQLVMNWAQKTVSPTRATLIYASEPIWGGLVGYCVGETLSPLTLAGAGFIISGVLASEMNPRWPRFRRVLRGAVVRRRLPSMSELVIYDSADTHWHHGSKKE